TSQVDFAATARQATACGFCVDGPTTQAEFLGRLGATERASALMAANPARASEIESGVLRLMAPNGMGTRFKAMALRSADVAPLPGFETA
ncbi:MAG: SAM-dependent methyltransferase, partial [Pseudomonadota bacterium]